MIGVVVISILGAPSLALAGQARAAATPGLAVSASVDKTKLAIGEQVTLTITLGGDFANVTMDQRGLPPTLSVVAQSRSQNIRIAQGKVERSVSLVYLLVPREPGTFQLGPFYVRQGGTTYATDPLVIEVIRNALPPPSTEPVERFIL